MSLLFKKFKPFIDFAYLWEPMTKLVIPPRVDVTSIYLKELDFHNKLGVNVNNYKNNDKITDEHIEYSKLASIHALRNAEFLHKNMILDKMDELNSSVFQASEAHIRYIQIYHANNRIINLLRYDNILQK